MLLRERCAFSGAGSEPVKCILLTPLPLSEVVVEAESAPINMQIWVPTCGEQRYFRCCMGILSVCVSLRVESPAAGSEIAHNSSDVNKSLKGVRMREMKDNYSGRGELL